MISELEKKHTERPHKCEKEKGMINSFQKKTQSFLIYFF